MIETKQGRLKVRAIETLHDFLMAYNTTIVMRCLHSVFAIMLMNAVSCSSIETCGGTNKNLNLNPPDYLGVSDVEKEPIQNIAASIIGCSAAEVSAIQEYIKYNKISPISNDKILIPGDGAMGTFLIERIMSNREVWFHVEKSGIEDEADKYEKSCWKLQNGRWLVKRGQ